MLNLRIIVHSGPTRRSPCLPTSVLSSANRSFFWSLSILSSGWLKVSLVPNPDRSGIWLGFVDFDQIGDFDPANRAVSQVFGAFHAGDVVSAREDQAVSFLHAADDAFVSFSGEALFGWVSIRVLDFFGFLLITWFQFDFRGVRRWRLVWQCTWRCFRSWRWICRRVGSARSPRSLCSVSTKC